MKRILITGSRDWPANEINTISKVLVETILGYLRQGETAKTLTIVHGACPRGADAMVDWMANHWGMHIERYPADWDTYGNSAGYIRNRQMVESGVDICLAFVYNKSKGASNTVDLCREKGVPIVLVER